LFLKFVWKPKQEWRFPEEERNPHPGTRNEVPTELDPDQKVALEEVKTLLNREFRIPSSEIEQPLTAKRVVVAWSPWIIMGAFLVVSGVMREAESKNGPYDFGIVKSYYQPEVPGLHNEVERARQLQKQISIEAMSAIGGGAVGVTATVGVQSRERLARTMPRVSERESAVFKLAWLTAPGTPVMLAALLSMLMLGMSRRQIATVWRKTLIQMKVPIPTIACMLGLSYVTKYAGMDATLGVAFAETGVLYPFFSALLGWVGCFLTGTDAGSNALFGSLQKITATEVYNNHPEALGNLSLGQTQVLICTANSTGGVMGKMIDAQSICVATAGTNQIGKEADIFKSVIWHSAFLACIVGALTALQAFVPPFTLMVPKP
jgi:lactate permease